MSINLSFTNKFKKTEPAAPGKDKDKEKEKKNRAAKQNPLLNAKTDPYVDDSHLYETKISKADKYEYWYQLLQNRGPRRPLPKLFKSWKSREIADVNEQANYSRFYLWSFSFISSQYWDQLFLNILLVWLIMLIFFVDKFADKYAPTVVGFNAGNQLLMVPPLLMFVTQVIPFVGTIYFTCNCNDLVHFRASKEIGKWAVVCALTSQYIEFFYYGGQGASDRAGNCKVGHAANPRPMVEFVMGVFAALRRRRHAQIDTEANDEDVEDQNKKWDSDDDIEVGKNREKKKSSKKGKDSEGDEDDDAPEGKSKKKKKSKSKKRGKSSKVAAGDSEKEGQGEDRDPTELVDFDEDGNEIKAAPIPHTDWTCIVCKKFNHKPTHCPIDCDINFGEKGVYYKRIYASIVPRRDMPTCDKCGTFADYTPPMGSAHLFPNNPRPHVAFEDYPKPSTVQAGMKFDINSRYYYAIKGFFFGIKDNINSAPLKNDWRLEKFVNNRFPELPRYILKEGEFFQIGEVVECKQQKFEWARCRILKVHPNHTYDIRYDPGDELRFVGEPLIRTIPEKRAYAYRVEMGLVLIAVISPLGIAVGLMNGNPGVGFLGMLIVSAGLLSIRIVTFVQYFYNYYDAGMCVILSLSAIYMLPLLFLMIASAVAVASGSDPASWATVAAMLVITMFFSLPMLYIFRPPYLTIGLLVYFPTSIGFILLSMYANNRANGIVYIAMALVPFLLATLFLKYLRRVLHDIWDVCLVTRKARDISQENPSILMKIKDSIEEAIDL